MIGRNNVDITYKDDGTVLELVVKCVFCGESQPPFEVSQREWSSYASGGVPAQIAFKNISADERELLISAICPKCWDKVIPNE